MPFPLGDAFQDALAFAHQVHLGQYRKGTGVPYLSHVLAVAALALEQGADEPVAIAALLHDAVEDGGGLPILDAIRARFGAQVADLVVECSDSMDQPKPAWRPRKEAYLAHLRQASAGARLISLCDKFHNATALVRDYGREGRALWGRFNATPAETAWYYRQVLETLDQPGAPALVQDLRRAVAELEAVVQAG